MSPFISIIIPVFNVENYICDCLDSVLSQEYGDFEVICIDDGSTDSSLEKLERMAFKDSRIRVFKQENRGPSAARNIGIDNANGKHILFLDGDDMLAKGALGILCRTAGRYTVDFVAYNTAPLLYEKNVPRDFGKEKYYQVSNSYSGIKVGIEHLTELIENDDFVDSAGLAMIDASWLKETGLRFVDGARYEDSIFILECYFRAKKMIHIDDGIYIYRIRGHSFMTAHSGFVHERWRLWQFCECLRLIFVWNLDGREKKAIVKYARQIMSNIKYNYMIMSDLEREKIHSLEPVAALMAESMDLSAAMAYNAELSLAGLISEIGSRENVLLYGAGLVGDKMYRILTEKKLDHKIIGYAVSNLVSQYEKNGLEVLPISDFKPETVDLLLISSSRYQNEMIAAATGMGFQDIYVVDYLIENALDRHFHGRQDALECG